MDLGLGKMLEKAGFVDADLPLPKDVQTTVAPATPTPQVFTTQTQSQIIPGAFGATMTPEDQEQMKKLESQIYATPSSYVPFREVRAVMGGTNDVATIMRMVCAANPQITPDKVKNDISGHLSIIASMRQAFDGNSRAAMDQRVTQPLAKIAELQQQLATISAEITRLQTESTSAKQKIDEGVGKFNMMMDKLAAPLKEANQLLGGV